MANATAKEAAKVTEALTVSIMCFTKEDVLLLCVFSSDMSDLGNKL